MRRPGRPAAGPGAAAVALLAVASMVASGLALAPAARAGDPDSDPSQPGAYCQLPESGEVPKCLGPAQARYGDLFVALDKGGDLQTAASRMETDLASGTGADAYLALSSLAYAYWRLALKAAETETVDPAIAARLSEWNDLLSHVYSRSDADVEFRTAVRDAARDLEAHTGSSAYRPADGLLSRLDQAGEQLGVRGAVRRVLHRVFDPTTEAE